MRQIFSIKTLRLVLIAAFLTACGGGGGAANDANDDGTAAEGSTWDQMEWDKGTWG